MFPLNESASVALIGGGATALMDLWLIVLRRLGIPTQRFALVGRWVGHLLRGRLRHAAIGQSPPVPGESLLGWSVHYAVGIAFAGLLVSLAGSDWLRAPTVVPALLFGVVSVIAPLFVMQPAMGAGIASRKTPTPIRNCLRSLATHAVFGLGLYLSALLLTAMSR